MVSRLLSSLSSPLSSISICRASERCASSSCACRFSFLRDYSNTWRIITMRDRGKNRKPLQKGRNLSIEAIQAIQALKRAKNLSVGGESDSGKILDIVLESKIRRLLKFDMMAVLGELQRQDESLLALQVFEEIRKEHWYKPKMSVYADIITTLARNGFVEEVERVCSYLMTERWDSDITGFNSLFRCLLDMGRIQTTMNCYRLMKLWEIDPDEETFRILILGLESLEETEIANELRLEAQNYFGCLAFLTRDPFSIEFLQSHQ